MEKDIKVEVKEMPELHVAYIRHTGPFKGLLREIRNSLPICLEN